MNLYQKYILPGILHRVMQAAPIMRQRARVVPLATGRVLEIGIGSGLNLRFYDAGKVTGVCGLDPCGELCTYAQREAQRVTFSVEFVKLSAEAIPAAEEFDTVLTTYTLCTIPDVVQALGEMRRVLKPGGQLVFCEHGLACDRHVQRVQNLVNPLWKMCSGGCHLDRDIPGLLGNAGFIIADMHSEYIGFPKFAYYNYWGVARK